MMVNDDITELYVNKQFDVM